MSLATSCTSCGTSFRVVQDQLKVSEGWVRCGKCGEVFNALEGLFDLERDGPPAMAHGTATSRPTAPEPAEADPALTSDPASSDEPAPPFGREFATPTPAIETSRAATASWMGGAEAEPTRHRDRPDFADARYDSAYDPDLVPPLRNESAPESELPPEPPSEFAESMLADETAPAFVRHADRRARWHDPRVRAALGVAALALLLLALGQVVHQRRDLIAATWPALRGPLFAWCGAVGCSIAPVRRIEEISVESTTLTRSPAPDAYTLSVTLRNRGAIALATPWIDLTLKEGEQAIARRVLAPGDFRTTLASLPPASESNLQLLLSAGNPRVNGYSVEIYYP